jgi:arylsulfatase A-like enzyme
LARGFVHYEDYRISVGQAIMSTSLGRMAFDTPPEADWRPGPIQQLIGRAFIPGRKSARQVNEDFLEWVDEEPDRPFFAFLNLFDAHRPYDAPSRIRRGFPPVDSAEPVMQRVAAFVQPPAADDVTDHELLEMRASYHAAIASLDEQLGLLLDALDERGRLQNTIIVLTSDHGEEFREHDGLGHGSNLYFWQLRVPLVIVAPGRTPPGGRVSQPVSLVDLPATLAPWLTGGSAGFPGRSLEASWTDDPDGSSVSMPIAELVPGRNRDRAARAMASDGLYVIRNVDGSVEVYDLAATPFQSQQLHVMESVADSLGRLLDDSVEPSDGGAPAASNASAGR